MATKVASILVVDDSADTTTMLSTLLDLSLPTPHVCHVTQSGEEAVQKLESSFFHLVITDIEMPGMTGIELCQKIYIDQPNTVVVIVSGKTDVKYPVAAMRAGAFDYVVKPIQVVEFIATVERALIYQEALMKKHFCMLSLKEEFGDFFDLSARLRCARVPELPVKPRLVRAANG